MKVSRFIYAGVFLLCLGLYSCSNSSEKSNGTKSQDDWEELFNGKDLSGWEQLEGDSKFEVTDQQIIGTTVENGTNTVLCTKEDYSNFVLKLDLKVDTGLNSGIQIRSHVNDDGEVQGAQIEVDPSERAWSGGIYDSRGRGWLIDLANKPVKQKAFKNGQWNHYKIRADGDTIETWVNEVPIATLIDTYPKRDADGFIGLQIHSRKRGGLQVRFKNIKIRLLK